jgi:hypothetical protein
MHKVYCLAETFLPAKGILTLFLLIAGLCRSALALKLKKSSCTAPLFFLIDKYR